MTREQRERQLRKRMLLAAAVLAVLVLAFVIVIRVRAGHSAAEAETTQTAAVQQTQNEAASEPAEQTQNEAASEPAEQAQTEAATGQAEETQTEAASEQAEQAQTEAATGQAEETQTEAASEQAEQAQTEAATGQAEQTQTEAASEPAEQTQAEEATGQAEQTEAASEQAEQTQTEAAAEPAEQTQTEAAQESGKSLVESVAEDAKAQLDVEKARQKQEAAERQKQAEEDAKKADVRTKEELAAMSIEELTEYLRYHDVPEELLKFMAEYPESREFVTDYMFRPETEPSMDISGEVRQGEFPHFLQWDERWGYKDYGGSFFAVAGCGPTAMSVVYSGLTGKTDMNPYAMGEWAEEMGYYIYGSGTSWEMMWSGASQLGLGAWEVNLDEVSMITTLQNGYPIIAAMSPGGDFTNFGHFIVLTGIDDNNNITVRDSNSIERTERTWTPEELLWQTAGMWAYSYYA